MSKTLDDKLLNYANNNLNVLMIGTHGVGKTMRCMSIAKSLNLKFKYYSSSTLDPFADIVGIPVPNQETQSLSFFRNKELEEAEFLFFDELNRAHPRVLNAVLEIIQFKSVNGTPLKNLKMVWAAINPPGGVYNVEELDPALIDRFHCYIKITSELNKGYLKTKMKKDTLSAISDWWDRDLDANQRLSFTPRRVEIVGMMIDKGLPWKDSVPQGHVYPLDKLSKALTSSTNPDSIEQISNKKEMIAKVDKLIESVKSGNNKVFLQVMPILDKTEMTHDEIAKIANFLELFPKDLLLNSPSIGKKWNSAKRSLKQSLFEKGVTDKTNPSLYEALKDN